MVMLLKADELLQTTFFSERMILIQTSAKHEFFPKQGLLPVYNQT